MEAIDEDRREIQTIIKEPIWYQDHEFSYRSLCDLIVVYKNYAVPVELKGNSSKKAKAVKQLLNGKTYIDEFIHRECNYGKFVLYGRDSYQFHKIDLGGTKWQQRYLGYGKDTT
jgi:hypothetical protein